MTNTDIAHYYRLIHRHGVDSEKVQEFENQHKNDKPLINRIAAIKKQYRIRQKRR